MEETWLKRRTCLTVLAVILLILSLIKLQQRETASFAMAEPAISAEELALNDDNLERAVRSRMIWDWAVECGAAETFSYDTFLRSLEDENNAREMIRAEGGPVYGPVNFTPLQYYRRLLGQYEQEILEQLAREIEASELAGYYEMYQERYREADTVEAKYTIRQNGRVIYEEDVILDDGNVRTFSEADEELVNNLLQLEEGGQCVWTGRNGEEKQLLCIRREQGALAPFDEVAGAVRDQCAGEKFEQELMIRTANYQNLQQREKEKH